MLRIAMALTSILCAGAAFGQSVYFQAHRGGLHEVPENTMVAMHHAWSITGAVPEIDVRTTADGVLIGLHDETLERTTNASPDLATRPVQDLQFEAIADLDAGAYFDAKFAGTKIPTMDAVLAELARDPSRRMYLDLKSVTLEAMADAIAKHGVGKQVIFVHGDPNVCKEIHDYFDGAPVMTWLSGSPRVIKRRFAEYAQREFEGIGQIQFHLRGKQTEKGITYALGDAYLREAATIAQDAGVALQVRPFLFDAASLRKLIDMGIHWYVSDDPKAFRASIEEALALPAEK